MRRAGAALLLCLLLCGCSWKDAGDLSAVTAGTISREGQQYQLTAELALPDADTAVPASKQVSGAAQTMEQAIDDTGAGLDVQLYWSHARVLFLDDTVLSGGIGSCVQELHADSAVRPSVRVCAVRESRAADIFACQSIGGEPVGFSVGDSLSYAIQQSQVPDVPLYRVYNALETQGIDPVLPAVSLAGEQVQLDGCALFSGETCSAGSKRCCMMTESRLCSARYVSGAALRRMPVRFRCPRMSRVRPMSRYAARRGSHRSNAHA